MATDSWYGQTNSHIRAPWERDVLSDSNSYSMELHGIQTSWNSSQCSMNSMDVGAGQCSYHSFSHSADGGVDYSRQFLYFSGDLPSTNPYFGDPDIKYTLYGSLYGTPEKGRDHIPPPWEDNTNHAISAHHLTNPYLNGHHNYIGWCNEYSFSGCNEYSFKNNSSSMNSSRGRRQFESFLSESKAKNTALYDKAVKSRDRRPPRSVSDRRMPPSEAPNQFFMRSLSFDSGISNQDTIPQYTKGRSLVEEVIENVVKKMVSAHSKTNMVFDMIFNPSILCRPNAPIDDDDDGFSRKLMQRILLLQIRELGPKLMVLALNQAEFKSQKWALNGQITENYPISGLRILLLHQRFMDIGMEAFNVLTKLTSQIPRMASEDGCQGTGILRVAVMAGNPGCSALGSHLFFLQHFPSLEIQTDLVIDQVGWYGILEAISVKGLGMVSFSFMEVIKHPTCLRSYRILLFMNSLGENLQTQEEEQLADGLWDFFWNNLYQNTSAMVLVVIYDTCLVWDEIKPRKGLWWFSSESDEDFVHILRKV